MRRVKLGMRVAAVITLASGLSAQAPADFSGRWVLAPDPPASVTQRGGRTPAGTMGSGWGADITITQDAASLIIEYAHFTRGGMQPPMKFVYRLDGADSRNTINVGRGPQEQVSRTAWVGNTLVITTSHRVSASPDGETLTSETRHALSLESPASLVIETIRNGVMGGQPSTTKTVYARKTS